MFIAPKAMLPSPGRVSLLLQIVIFGAAVLAGLGHRPLPTALSLVVIANAALTRVWDQ